MRHQSKLSRGLDECRARSVGVGAKITDADIAKEKVVMAEQIIAPTKLDYAKDPK
jgi:hypothetical protein